MKKDEVWEAMKREHETKMVMLDQLVRENPKAVVNYIGGELAGGKVLIIPQAIYNEVIASCREYGMSEEALKNIHKSTYLKSYS